MAKSLFGQIQEAVEMALAIYFAIIALVIFISVVIVLTPVAFLASTYRLTIYSPIDYVVYFLLLYSMLLLIPKESAGVARFSLVTFIILIAIMLPYYLINHLASDSDFVDSFFTAKLLLGRPFEKLFLIALAAWAFITGIIDKGFGRVLIRIFCYSIVIGALYAGISVWDQGSFHMAALHGKTAVISRMVKSGYDPDTLSATGLPAIYYAVLNDQQSAIAALAKMGANVNFEIEKKTRPINYAAKYATPDSIHALIQAGADVNNVSDAGSPLLLALGRTRDSRIDGILKVLVEGGARLGPDERESAFDRAKGNLHVLNYLIEKRVINPTLEDAVAVPDDNGAIELMQKLLKSGANVNRLFNPPGKDSNTFMTPLEMAVEGGSSAKAAFLMDHGATVYHHNDTDALEIAVEAGNTGLVDTLLKHGAPLNQKHFDDANLLSFNQDRMIRLLKYYEQKRAGGKGAADSQ